MNVGTIGTGGITTWFLTCWQELGNSCHAIYSRTLCNGEALKEKFHASKVYTDLDEFMADDQVDVVYIASPNSLHFSHARKALLSNHHVILEKPFTSTLEECEELIALAKERHLFLMEGITVVDLPNRLAIPALLEEIAPIHMSVANMSKVSSKYHAYCEGEQPNVFTTRYSGGALMDLNVYNLHFMTSLFGMPENLQYVADKHDGIDMSGCLTMRYADQIVVCIASKNSEAESFVELQGERGTLRVNSAAAMTSFITLKKSDGSVQSVQLQDHKLTHIYYLRAFLRMIEEQDYVERDERLQHTHDVMSLLVAARRSADIRFEADQ